MLKAGRYSTREPSLDTTRCAVVACCFTRVSPNDVSQMTELVSAAERIDELYQTMLGRLPDPDARKSCVAFLANGGTLEILAQEIERSTEYRQWQAIIAKIEVNRKRSRLDKNPVSQVPEIYHDDLVPHFTFREKYRPLALIVETINICNNDCIICPYSLQRRSRQTMSLALFTKVIRDYAAVGGGNLGLTPMTGEIFLDKFLQKRLDVIKSEPSINSVSAITNGSMVHRYSEAQLAQILAAFDRLSISIYGLDAEEYELMTRKNQYDRMVEGMIRLLALGGTNKVLLAIRHLKPRTPEQVQSWLAQIAVRAGVKGIQHSSTRHYANWSILDTSKPLPYDAEWMPLRENHRQCAMPLVSAQVLSDGTVSFCACMDFDGNSDLVLGNIRDVTLAELLDTEKVWKLWNWAAKGVPNFCKTCTAHRPIESLLRMPSVFTEPLAAFGS